MSTATPTEPVMADNHAEARRQALEARVLLLAPSFGYWIGRYQLPRGKMEIAVSGASVDGNDVTTPQSKLITDKFPTDSAGIPWQKRFRAISNAQTALIEESSVPFPIRGVRIVPKSRGSAFLAAMRDIQADLATAADAFVADLDGILRQIERNTKREVWQAIQHKIPRDPDKMRAKFYVDVTPIELAGGGASAPTLASLQDEQDFVRQATHRKVEEAIEEMIAGPRNELSSALAGLQDVIARNGRVSTKSFNPVAAAIAKIRAFDFVATPTLLQQIDRLEERMGLVTPSTLDRVSAASNGFSAALAAVVAEVHSAAEGNAAYEEFGKEFRQIDLGDE